MKMVYNGCVNLHLKEDFMENKKRSTILLASISTVIACIAFIWFSFRPGLMGTFHWHLGIFGAYLFLLATVLFPALFLLIYLCTNKNNTRILSKVFSYFSMILWILIFIGLTVLSFIPAEKEGLNQLYQTDELPVNDGKLKAHYAFTSDPHWGSGSANAEARTKIMQNIDKGDYDAMFILGDISEVGMITSIYQGAINDMRENLKNTKVMIMPGNHDGIVNGMPAFKRIFMNKGDKMYYRMDNGKIHLLFLFMLWDDTEFSKTQEKWLEKQLETIPQEDTVIVLSHCYILGSGYYDSAAKKNWGDIPGVVNTLCPILEKYNVDLALNGHNHFFESLEKDGVDYMILGSMGGKLDTDLIYSSPYSKWVNNTDFGWLDVKIYDNKIDLNVMSVEGETLFKKSINSK